jgi:4-hydroxy-tetrahydrodipicolinate synthase
MFTRGSKFTGCGTALVTPFRPDLSIDEKALRVLVERQISAGIDFLVPCGTTGESPTLEYAEHLRVCEITVEQAAGRVPVVAGAGGYNTQHVIHMAKDLEKAGVDGLLSVTPYYNKPTQEGLYQHYLAIAESTPLPIIVYSVQTRTLVNVEPATVARLAQIKNIVALKEASGSMSQMASILAQVPEEFAVLSGDDALALPLIALGGQGVISVVSNQIPGEFTELTHAALDGDFARARAIQRKYQALMEVNFVEVSPGPVKYALARMGLLEPVWRLPMVAPSAASEKKVDDVLQALGMMAVSGATV